MLGTDPEQPASPVPVAATRIAELRDLLARFIGPERAERVFAGTYITEIEVREKALAWVPEVMRFVSAAPEAGDPVERPVVG